MMRGRVVRETTRTFHRKQVPPMLSTSSSTTASTRRSPAAPTKEPSKSPSGWGGRFEPQVPKTVTGVATAAVDVIEGMKGRRAPHGSGSVVSLATQGREVSIFEFLQALEKDGKGAVEGQAASRLVERLPLDTTLRQYTDLARSLGQRGQLDALLALHALVKKRLQRELDSVYYLTLLSSFSDNLSLARANEFLHEMGRLKVPAWAAHYNSLIKGYCHQASMAEAVSVLDEMDRRNVPADVVTFNTLLAACARYNYPRVHAIWRSMVSRGLKPDVITLTNLVRAFSAIRRYEEARDAYDTLVAEGVETNSVSDTFMVGVYFALGQRRTAEEAATRLVRTYGAAPALWNLLMSWYLKTGEQGRALYLAGQMLRMEAPGASARDLASSDQKGNDSSWLALAEALETTAAAVSPTTASINVVLRVFAQCPRAQGQPAVEALLESLHSRQFTPSTETYTAVAALFVQWGQEDRALALLKDMEPAVLRRNQTYFDLLLPALARQHRLEDMLEVYGLMRSIQLRGTKASYAALLNAFAEAARWDTVADIMQDMALRHIPTPPTLDERLKLMYNHHAASLLLPSSSFSQKSPPST